MRARLPVVVALVALTSLVVGACSSSSKTSHPAAASGPTTTLAPIPAPPGLPAFYAVPRPLPRAAGSLLRAEPIDIAGLHGRAYRVLYTSAALDGSAVAVSGMVVVPSGAPPRGGFPVVSWAHGTDGMADKCAPSLHPNTDVPIANALLDKGWVVTATDYRGEGTPGLMPYIAGDTAARDTIDIVRAARHMTDVHASDRFVIWGHSEGGHTAMFGLKIGSTYAPELHLEGVVAGAPPSQFKYIYTFLLHSPFKHYLLMAAGGIHAAFGDRAPLDAVLTPAGIRLLPVLDQGCSGDVAAALANVDVATVTKGDPFTIPKWKDVLSEDDPQSFTTSAAVPLLIIQGGNDEQIPVVSTQLLASHLCSIGQDLERWIYPGQSHAGVIAPSANDMIRWIADRFAGGSNPDPYAPTGQKNVQVTKCP